LFLRLLKKRSFLAARQAAASERVGPSRGGVQPGKNCSNCESLRKVVLL
jgi:hypothetical protein